MIDRDALARLLSEGRIKELGYLHLPEAERAAAALIASQNTWLRVPDIEALEQIIHDAPGGGYCWHNSPDVCAACSNEALAVSTAIGGQRD